MHRIISNPRKGEVVDHINHNKLDNRKCNLRNCSQFENMANQSKSKANTSGYTGVFWDKNKSKWYSRIGINGKYIHLGYFNNKEDAVKARKEAEIKYYGEYRYKEELHN